MRESWDMKTLLCPHTKTHPHPKHTSVNIAEQAVGEGFIPFNAKSKLPITEFIFQE